jgi:hypothetical protein
MYLNLIYSWNRLRQGLQVLDTAVINVRRGFERDY